MGKTKIDSAEYPVYYQKYVEKVGGSSVKEVLLKGEKDLMDFFQSIPNEKYAFRYAAEKWSIQQILLHLIDTERVFSYRALTFARSKNAELKSYDENLFAENSKADHREWENLVEEYKSVRKSTISLFQQFYGRRFQEAGKSRWK